MTILKIFSKTIVTETGCWEWQGCTAQGYGRIRFNGKTESTHRVVFSEWYNVVIKEGGLICHKCDNRLCVNPEHLYLGNHFTNNRDTARRDRHASQQNSHCKNGHPFSGVNLIVNKKGHRVCRECRNTKGREFHAKNRDIINASKRLRYRENANTKTIV